MAVTDYSRTPANNNSAPPNGAPEGWAPSAVNNVIRQIMTDIVNEAVANATKVLASVAGTDTITASATPDLTAYSTGMILLFTPANNNTGAVTINVDSLGAKSITKGDATALVADDLQASSIHAIIYDGTRFVLLNPNSTAFYDATTANFTGTLQYGGIEVGYRGMRQLRTFSAADSTAATDAGGGLAYTGTGGHTLTLDSDLATNAIVTIINGGSGNLAIAASTSLDWYNGSGTLTNGNRALAVAGWATAWHSGSGNYRITGTGLS